MISEVPSVLYRLNTSAMTFDKSFFLNSGFSGMAAIASLMFVPNGRKNLSGVACKLALLTSLIYGKSAGNISLKMTLPTVVTKYE